MIMYLVSKVVELVAKDPKVLSNHDQIALICSKNHNTALNDQSNESICGFQGGLTGCYGPKSP